MQMKKTTVSLLSKSDSKGETFLHPVKLPLTEKEQLAYMDELTALDSKNAEISLRHESEKSRFKGEVKEINKNQSRLMNLLKAKEEIKQVPCYNHFSYLDGIVEICRVDTGEIATTRKMTAEEYQQNLPLEFKEDNGSLAG